MEPNRLPASALQYRVSGVRSQINWWTPKRQQISKWRL